jgi:hypothetical protein
MPFPGAFCFEETRMKMVCLILFVIYGSFSAFGQAARSVVETASKARTARIEAAVDSAIR